MKRLKKLKCPNWIKPRLTPRTCQRKADKRKGVLRWDYSDIRSEPLPEDFERCGGDLSVEVIVYNAPDWGGTTAELDVGVTCNVCGVSYIRPLQHMTDEEWVEELVAEALDRRVRDYAKH